MSEIAIGIDLGGTRIKAVAIDRSGTLFHPYIQPTIDVDDMVWKKDVAVAVQDIQHKMKLQEAVVGISAPGLPNKGNTAIAFMPGRLQGLENFDWTVFLDTRTYVLNDAVAALMAEARYGAARGCEHVAMLTLGTGVGGALLLNGKPYQGAFGKAGHLGHMVIDSLGDRDITGIPGSLEDAIGNCTIARRSFGRFGTTKELLDAFRQGDPFASEIWLTSVRKLAAGIASLTNILSPEMVVVGGGIADADEALFEPLEKYLDLFEWRAGGHKARIVKAVYGEMAGAVGAACFARESCR